MSLSETPASSALEKNVRTGVVLIHAPLAQGGVSADVAGVADCDCHLARLGEEEAKEEEEEEEARARAIGCSLALQQLATLG